MKGCVACNNLWPWPISSRSFGLGLENRVRSVASTVLDGFFPYLVQMISSMRRCVACDNLWPWPISSRSFDLDFENRVRSVMFSVLDRLFPYLPQIITTIRGCVEGAYPRRWHRLICLVHHNRNEVKISFWSHPNLTVDCYNICCTWHNSYMWQESDFQLILVNTLRPRQNGRRFLDDIFKWIFKNETTWIEIEISLKFVPRGLIDNIPALV